MHQRSCPVFCWLQSWPDKVSVWPGGLLRHLWDGKAGEMCSFFFTPYPRLHSGKCHCRGAELLVANLWGIRVPKQRYETGRGPCRGQCVLWPPGCNRIQTVIKIKPQVMFVFSWLYDEPDGGGAHGGTTRSVKRENSAESLCNNIIVLLLLHTDMPDDSSTSTRTRKYGNK